MASKPNKYTECKENFNLNKLKFLSPYDAKQYITRYFVPLSNGTHAFYNDGKYEVREDQEIKRTYFNRMSKELSTYYFNEYTDIKTITYELNRPLFFDDKINLCPPLKFSPSNYTPTPETKEKLDFILNYMLEILCNNNKDQFDFLLKWISNMLHGNKNKSCLYLKGPQGVGKSTLYNFLKDHVIGKHLSLSTGSDPIRTKFNEMLGGKLLVCFEELENFSKAEWESISSRLKDMITNDTINLQNKCTKAYEASNINNYMLNSNHDAIKDDDGRRYFILDINPSRQGDHDYYSKLYSCFNDEVGEAFFNHVYNINIVGFNSQVFPVTQNKLDSHSKRLDSVLLFLKEYYVLLSKNIDIKCRDLHAEYIRRGYKNISIEEFNRRLNDNGVKKTKVDGHFRYVINSNDLIALATKRHWLSQFDEFVTESIDDTKLEDI